MRRFLLIVLLLTPGITLTGCEEGVVAVLGTGRPYSLYGVITPTRDFQAVRVFEIKDKLDLIGPELLDATFTSLDLTTNEKRVWTDSVTIDDRGRYSHMFWSGFTPAYGHRYRIEIVRSDGEMSSAEVGVPTRAELLIDEPFESRPRVIQPIRVQGSQSKLINVEVTYRVKYAPGVASNETTTEVVVPYGDAARKEGDDAWTIDVLLSDDIRLLREELSKSGVWLPSFGVWLSSMSARLLVVDEAWDPPAGSFDAEVLIEPGTLSNIENGFGFIGAGYALDKTWRPDNDILVAAGFREMDDGDDPDDEEGG